MLAGPVTALPADPLRLRRQGAALHDDRHPAIYRADPDLPDAVFVFGEPFSHWQLIAFIFIWSALALYTLSLFRR
jgi:chloramphenicol-sensitive protein RarD